jgi:hypothetical protein
MEDAARHIYEMVEKKDVLDDVITLGSDPSTTLNHFKYALLTLDGIVLYGVQPPSSGLRPIPDDETSASASGR